MAWLVRAFIHFLTHPTPHCSYLYVLGGVDINGRATASCYRVPLDPRMSPLDRKDFKQIAYMHSNRAWGGAAVFTVGPEGSRAGTTATRGAKSPGGGLKETSGIAATSRSPRGRDTATSNSSSSAYGGNFPVNVGLVDSLSISGVAPISPYVPANLSAGEAGGSPLPTPGGGHGSSILSATAPVGSSSLPGGASPTGASSPPRGATQAGVVASPRGATQSPRGARAGSKTAPPGGGGGRLVKYVSPSPHKTAKVGETKRVVVGTGALVVLPVLTTERGNLAKISPLWMGTVPPLINDVEVWRTIGEFSPMPDAAEQPKECLYVFGGYDEAGEANLPVEVSTQHTGRSPVFFTGRVGTEHGQSLPPVQAGQMTLGAPTEKNQSMHRCKRPST
jgi:hypothetical protein